MEPLGVLAMTGARSFGFVLSLPLGEAMPVLSRLFLAVLIGAALAGPSFAVADSDFLLVGREFVIGYLLGYPFRFVTDIAEFFGELLDVARGQTIASIIDPLNGPSCSDLAAILRAWTCAIALQAGVLVSGCSALRRSFFALPPTKHIEMTGWSAAVLKDSYLLLEDLFLTFTLFVAAFVGIDLIAGLGAKVCSQLSFGTVGHLAKFMVLLFIGALSILYWEGEMVRFLSALNSHPPAQAIGRP
jgi:type III secretory pathway component EscT